MSNSSQSSLFFKKLDAGFRRFLTLSTAMDFDGRHFRMDRKTYTSFYIYMWLFGKKVLFRTRSFPSICNFEHRWHWIDKRMLNIWKKVETSDKALARKMEAFMKEVEGSLTV